MPMATRDLYHADLKLSKLDTSYQVVISRSTLAPLYSAKSPMPSSRELPMPTVSRITSLAQAQATLQHCSAKLSKSWQHRPARASPPGSPMDSNGKRHFQQWLEQWEQAFTAYLSCAMPTMKSEDLTRSRILKANHLSCIILAADIGPHPSSYEVFDSEFQAIVELSSAVIQSRPEDFGSASSSESPTERGTTSTGLDIEEPLYVVIARCNRVPIRKQAIDLLADTSRR